MTLPQHTNGNYGLLFTPEIPGTYQIIATFDGSNYGTSTATTYMAVGEAPATTPAPTPQAQSVADAYFVPAIAGLFAFMAIIGVVIIHA